PEGPTGRPADWLFLVSADLLHERLEFVVAQAFGRFHPGLAFRILEAFLERLESFLVGESRLDLGVAEILDSHLLADLRVALAFGAVTFDAGFLPILFNVRSRGGYCRGQAK